jgi:MFS transporter, SP family, general alpha glucoside:H+ symporter
MAVGTDEKNFHLATSNDEKPSPVQQAPRPTTESGENDESDEKRTMDDLIRNARLATEKEHSMTLLQGIKLYPKAIGWSILISTCIVMEGYDVALINNFYGNSQFNRKYGEPYVTREGGVGYQVSAAWQAGLSNGAVVVS